jgi:hypothetical protein
MSATNHIYPVMDAGSPVAAFSARHELADLSHKEIMTQAGAEAVELIMWLVMRGAMAPSVEQLHINYYAPMTTGMGLTAMRDPG